MTTQKKRTGSFFTPADVAETLVRWAVRRESDRLLDPSCGDGRFLAAHRHCAGVEVNSDAVIAARRRAPWANLHNADFFDWAQSANELFDCAAGNPPFIRYQLFAGETRRRALAVCRELGADFSALTSSWAPFLVATCGLLRDGGRIAFVVPAEIGHAPYAKPLIHFLTSRFETVHVVALREKLFPQLSEDAWLLYASGFGQSAPGIRISAQDQFRPSSSPLRDFVLISNSELAQWNYRLRPFLLSADVRDEYLACAADPKSTVRLSGVASVGIGYVSGANDFFHLRPSDAIRFGIDEQFTETTVRSSRQLSADALTKSTIREWIRADRPILLLRVFADDPIPRALRRYLDSSTGQEARTSYKCRNRKPWYVVPDVQKPDAFLSYMCGETPVLVENQARCVCSNAVHAVHLTDSWSVPDLQRAWREPLTQLSCEIEGHPLGGGMLKLEPREAGNVVLRKASASLSNRKQDRLREGVATMRAWRHYD